MIMVTTFPIIKKLGCSVIGVSGNNKSTLSKISDYHQLIKVEKEACPLDLAPTSSATATLVWGDALAISLMNKKGMETIHAVAIPAYKKKLKKNDLKNTIN